MDVEFLWLLITYGPIVFAVGVVCGFFGPDITHSGRKRK